MDDLIELIQKDPQLWEIVDQLKHQDEDLEDFILSVSQMLAVEFNELHRTDLIDKLHAFFGGLPAHSYKMLPYFLHIALDLFILEATPNHDSVRG